jgi:aspartyl-tRNA(Asn)/glutamyl-tRNA(Gln) amidotransferase subunit A
MGLRDTLLRLSAVALAQLYRQRDRSPMEVIRAVLTRSVQRQADLNAFAYLDDAGALAAARAAEQRFQKGGPLGPFDGAPVSVKDLLDVCGVVTGHGALSTAHNTPAASDAPAVRRLREQGAVLFAKTTTHAFGLGSLLNPYIGTDGNGSIRVPSAYTGLVGF